MRLPWNRGAEGGQHGSTSPWTFVVVVLLLILIYLVLDPYGAVRVRQGADDERSRRTEAVLERIANNLDRLEEVLQNIRDRLDDNRIVHEHPK